MTGYFSSAGLRGDRAGAPTPEPVVGLHESRRALTPEPVVDPVVLTATVAAELRRWRTEQARRASVRPTVVLSDRALDAIARARPRTAAELAAVAGLGPVGRERHGARLLAIVAEHASAGAGTVPEASVPTTA